MVSGAAVLIIAASWGVGKWLSKIWRMPDYSFRFGLVLFSLIAGVVICAWRWPPKLGIDLKGGVILIYEVAEEQQAAINLAEPLDRIPNYLANKVDAETQVRARGSDRVVVSAKTTDDAEVTKIQETVESIPFRDVKVVSAGSEAGDGGTNILFRVTSATAASSGGVEMEKLVAALNRRINPGGQKEVVVRKFGERQVEIIIPEADPQEINLIKQKISTAGLLEFRILANDRDDAPAIELARKNPLAKDVIQDGKPIARWVGIDNKHITSTEGMETRTNEAGEKEVLVRIDPYNVTGGYLAHAATGHDEFGQLAVDFSFKSDGAILFGELTDQNRPDPTTGFRRRLGIVLDGRLFSAPELRSAITSRGQITGGQSGFKLEEVQFLVEILNAGHLPAALDKTPVSQTNISPQLGEETVRNGSITMIVSMLMILVFMLVYYRFSGAVADIAVVMNVILVVALMITLGAAFTLAGLAGLVLSVGMAVDANVLIYERMREELQRGAALRMAIRNGFGRAMSTIIDSNLTTLLTGVVLYAIGTDQLKGFAITLILGLLLNLFTAVYVARVFFDVAERRRWITELKMMKMFDAPNFDFVKPTKYAVAVSLLVIAVGLVAAVSRGEGLFGIDFTGGTSVQIVLDKNRELSVADVRNLVEPEDPNRTRLEDVTVSAVGLPDADGKGRYYKIDTSIADISEVEARLKAIFGDRLEVYQMNFEEPKPIERAADTSVTSGAGGEAKRAEGNDGATGKSADAKSATKSENGKALSSPDNAAAKKEAGDANQSKGTSESKSNDAVEKEKTTGKATDSDTKSGVQPTTKESTPKNDSADKEPTSAASKGSAKEDSKESTKENGNGNEKGATLRLRRSWFGLSAVPALAMLQDDGKDAKSKAGDKNGEASAAKSEATQAAKAKSDETPVGSEAAGSKDTTADKESPSPTGGATTTKANEDNPAKHQPSAPAKNALPQTTTFPQSATPERPEAQGAIFAGGSATTVMFKEDQGIGREALLGELEASANELKLQPAQFLLEPVPGTEDEYNTRLYRGWKVQTTLARNDSRQVLAHVQERLAKTPRFLSANNIGGKVANHAQIMAVYALFASFVMIVIYVWVRFQNIVFGLAAVVALVHDVLVTVAALAVSYYVAPYLGWAMVDPFKISLDVVAALLTIVGFSINDTIVIFDRIREIKGKSPQVTEEIINKAVNQTLGRTILTSGTVLIVTIILYVGGGQEIHPFAFAMLVGVIAGTYSSVYIASPLILWMRKPEKVHKSTSPRGNEVAMRV